MEDKVVFKDKIESLNLNYITRLLSILTKNEDIEDFEIEEAINGQKFKIQKKKNSLTVSSEDGRAMTLDISVHEGEEGYEYYKETIYSLYASMDYLLPNNGKLNVSQLLEDHTSSQPSLKEKNLSLEEEKIDVSYLNDENKSHATIWLQRPEFYLQGKDRCDVTQTEDGIEICFKDTNNEHYKVDVKDGKVKVVMQEEEKDTKDVSSLIDSYSKHLPTCKEALNVYKYLYKDLDYIVFSKQELLNVIIFLEEKIKMINDYKASERGKFDSVVKELSDEEYLVLKKVLKRFGQFI